MPGDSAPPRHDRIGSACHSTMEDFDRLVRARVIHSLRDFARAPTAGELAAALDADPARVARALHALADEHRLALLPGTDDVWMVHPFSAVRTDHVVRIGARRWFANCVWDGLAILGLLGDGELETRLPASGEAMRFAIERGKVTGEGIVHFLVPARAFWDDIGFT